MNGTTICPENKYDSNTKKRAGRVVEVVVALGNSVVLVGTEVGAVMVWVLVGVDVAVEVEVEIAVVVEVIKVLTNERRTYEKRNAMPHRGVLSDRGRLYP